MRVTSITLTLCLTAVAFVHVEHSCRAAQANAERRPTTVITSLDGDHWLLAPDPDNVGRDQQWWKAPVAGAKPTKVPWIIQDAFPGYHGVAWYWHTFTAPANPHADGRFLLRFWAVDYLAEVWLNGVRLGTHEGGEEPFLFDVTAAIKPGAENLLAVRVLNPTHQRIDGIVLNETPHRNKALPYGSGSAWDQGGIIDSVELLAVPVASLADLFVRPDPKTGDIAVQIKVTNASDRPVSAQLDLCVAPDPAGPSADARTMNVQLPPGNTQLDARLKVDSPQLWQLNDPALYRVTAQLASSQGTDQQSTRCGFRDFRFADGYFRLNGRRIYLRCSHTGNCCPIGLELPHDPDILRRDLLNCKVMGFNSIRFIAGVPKRYQLNLCDEIGLMVYEESYAAWCLGNSPQMGERYDASTLGMVRRDRNHPSVVMWGLLNETPDGPLFRHAVAFLPKLRQVDDSRMVILSSGRWDLGGGGVVGIDVWRNQDRDNPCVTYNPTKNTIKALGITWVPGQLGFHPGSNGEYGVVRWSAPADGTITVNAQFASIAEQATTDVHLLHNRTPLFDGFINVQGGGPAAAAEKQLTVRAGDTIDCAVGFGNGNYGADSTGLKLIVRDAAGKVYDAAADIKSNANPNGPWSYGWYAAAAKPDAATFKPFDFGNTETRIGSLSNPGSDKWEDVLDDIHPYKGVPHTAQIIHELRTAGNEPLPVFISEYGIGSAVDLVRVVKRYEQLGKAGVEDAQFYRQMRDRFLVDWHRWHLDDTFARPEDYFTACLAKMADQRALGLNAIRSNPRCVGYSLTGTVDQGMTGEGLTTTFREFKPGTIEAIADGFAPLRWCLFAEPLNVYRGAKVHIEAVLANEDALLPGDYPVRFEVVGPNMQRLFRKDMTIRIPEWKQGEEPPLAIPLLADDVVIDGPTGTYQFYASFLQKAAATGGATQFFVTNPADMPAVQTEVVLWGDDPELAAWLAQHGIRTHAPDDQPTAREVILIGRKGPADAKAFRDLATRVARGSTAIFLCPEVLRKGDQSMGWAPLVNKGNYVSRPSWLYLKDEWAKRHPIFDGLPSGGLLDLAYYRELIPAQYFEGQDPPAEAVAGAINAAQAYSSGLLVSVDRLGAGRFILNTLRIRDCLGQHPAAERLLRNMLRFAAQNGDQPLADLPPDFDQQLNSFGYTQP